MAVLPVLRMGHPLLAQRAAEVTAFNTAELDRLVEDMLDTLRARDGAGLAAPQIGTPLRVIAFGFDSNPRYPQAAAVPRTVLVNPKLRILDKRQDNDWEGCLSLPGLRGRVPRYRAIEYCGFNPAGEALCVRAEGFHARVVQHENDHLDGILYPQRMPTMADFGYTEELLAGGLLPTSANSSNDEPASKLEV